MTAVLVLGLLLAAAPASAVLVVSVGGPPDDPAYLAVHAAAALGTFQAEGVVATLRRAKHPTAAIADLRDGEGGGIAVTTMDQAVRGGAARGMPVRVVAAHTQAPAVALLLSTRHRGQVTGLTDLRGRRVGVPAPGTTGALILASLLRARRIEPWQVDLVSLGGPTLVARLASGDLVAAAVEEPWTSRALATGAAEVLLDVRRPEDAVRHLGGPFYEVVSVTRAAEKDLAALEPALVAYARALVRVQAWLSRTPPAEVVARLPAGLVADPDRLVARLDAQRAAYAPGAEATPTGLAATIEVLRAGGPWPAAIRVTPEALREPTAVTEARTRLGPNPPAP